MVLQNAVQEAQSLSQAQIGTDALLLSLLRVDKEKSPNAHDTRLAAFPGIAAQQVGSLGSRLGV